MTHVRGHYRRNGSYVRPHTRRTTPRTPGATTRVRAHYRGDGTYVRSHDRTVTARQSAPADGSGCGSLLLVGLVILLILAAIGIIAS